MVGGKANISQNSYSKLSSCEPKRPEKIQVKTAIKKAR
jgi:hypothetical protein